MKDILQREFYSNLDPKYKTVLKRVADVCDIVSKTHIGKVTDFLDPYEQELAIGILNTYDKIQYELVGGYNYAERKVICIFPFYEENFESDVKIIEISGEVGSHRDVLGSMLGLGVVREKLGDILVFEDRAYVFIKSSLLEFFLFNLKTVGRNKVSVKEITADELKLPEPEYIEKAVTISSLRLDTFLAGALNYSRSKANDLVKSGRVKLNFKEEINPSAEVSEGMTISVRGFGRIIFDTLKGNTRKGKYLINIKIPK